MQEHHVDTQSKSPITPGVMLAGAGLVLAAGAVAYAAMSSQQSAPDSTESTTATSPAAEIAATNQYKDGIYAVTGNYTSPGGEEEIGVTVTLENNLITNVEVEPRATRPISVKMQTAFSEGYQEFVMGKNIDEVQLDKVSGSSLTPKGFNDAIEKVKQEAQS